MPAYFAYVEPRYRDFFMSPSNCAYMLYQWKQANFDIFDNVALKLFMGQGAQAQGPGGVPLANNPAGRFDFTGEACGVVMCGTTSELSAGLTPMTVEKKGAVTGLFSMNKDLAAYYVRVNFREDNKTRTLINIGSLADYWQGTDYKKAGKRYKWSKLWTGTSDSIKFVDVRDKLAPRAEGKLPSLSFPPLL